jgi:hypothetical protein
MNTLFQLEHLLLKAVHLASKYTPPYICPAIFYHAAEKAPFSIQIFKC